MRITAYVFAALLVISVRPLEAVPFQVLGPGIWAPVVAPDNDGSPFWDNPSEDCLTCAAGWQWGDVQLLVTPTGENVGFAILGWDQYPVVEFLGMTDYLGDGTLHYDPVTGTLTFDNGHGFTSSSWQGTFMLLTRHETSLATIYDLWIDDLEFRPIGWVLDWNDARFQLAIPKVTVPEPTGLLLVGLALALRRSRLHNVQR